MVSNGPEGQCFVMPRSGRGRAGPGPLRAAPPRRDGARDTALPRPQRPLEQAERCGRTIAFWAAQNGNAPLGSHPFFLCSGLDQGLCNLLTAPPAATASISGSPGSQPAHPQTAALRELTPELQPGAGEL